MKARKITKCLITSIVLAMLLCSTLAYANEDMGAVVVEDNEYYKIAEKYDGDILYRAINSKSENIITLYTIVDDITVETEVFDLNETEGMSSRILYPVQSYTDFGYALATPSNHFRCPARLRDTQNLSSAAISVNENTYPAYQEDFIEAVDDMISLEKQLEAYSTEENFVAIMGLIVKACLDPTSAFEAMITASEYDLQERLLGKQIHAKEIVATSRFLFLYDFAD